MRRPVMAVTLGGVLLIGAGCSSNSQPSTTPASTTAATSAAPSASVAPSASAADYTADTKKVCGEVEKVLTQDMNAFVDELGKIILYQQTGNPALADKAATAAQQKLKTMAADIEDKTAAAQDPDFRTAGQQAASNIRAAASNDKLLASLKDPKLTTAQERKAVDKLQKQMGPMVAPLGAFCFR
jgi:argininosuccinate lyase